MNASMPASARSVLANRRPHVCPWWLGWGLTNPLRRWFNNPDAVLGSFVQPGDRVLEIGPGPGFYTVPLARLVGSGGKVVCVDIQQRMLLALERRLARMGLGDRVETICCAEGNAWLERASQLFDKVVMIYVLHEVPDPRQALAEAYTALRPGGELLLVEPKGHCSPELFTAELWAARDVGFTDAKEPIWPYLSRFQAALFQR
jgi:ubiquinone/menaquinone biosynthesis C-methylase UbiE